MSTPNAEYVPYVTHVRTPEGDGLVTQLPTPNTVIVKLGVYPFATRHKAFWRSDVRHIDGSVADDGEAAVARERAAHEADEAQR